LQPVLDQDRRENPPVRTEHPWTLAKIQENGSAGLLITTNTDSFQNIFGPGNNRFPHLPGHGANSELPLLHNNIPGRESRLPLEADIDFI